MEVSLCIKKSGSPCNILASAIAVGAPCMPCTNSMPASAKYSAPSLPIHNNFCQWTCKGIYDRGGERCVLGRGAILAVVISSVTFLMACVMAASYNAFRRLQSHRSQIAIIHDLVRSSKSKLLSAIHCQY